MARIKEGERTEPVLVRGGVIKMQYNPSPCTSSCNPSGSVATPGVQRFPDQHLDKGRDNEPRHSDASPP